MSGAKNCPETPRQKMIGMMYLVLTAMLALNVSADVLNGFLLVDESLRTTIKATDMRNETLYDEFQYIYEQNPEKTKEWLDKATQVKLKSDTFFNYIQNFKYEMVKMADGDETDPNLEVIVNLSNTDVTGTYALVQRHGAELKEKMAEYKDFLISFVTNDSARARRYEVIFETPDRRSSHSGEMMSWEYSIFESMPLGATVTILTKIQNDIRSVEADLINYLKNQTDALDFRVNKIEALVVPNSKYVIKGGKYSAQIVLSAVDSTKVPQIYVGSRELDANGLYEVSCGSTGSFNYSGYIQLQKNDGSIAQYPFKSEYIVGEPSVTISNTDLNVVYRGYDNKFSVSVPGVSSDKVKVNVVGAVCRQSGKGWIIRPEGSNKEVTIQVSAEVDGKMQSMGSSVYRVKALPKPMAYLNAGENKMYNEGNIPRNALINGTSFLEASYGPDGLLNLDFKITGFTLMTDYGTTEARGNKFTAAQLQQLKQLKKGALVNIVNIKAAGPDGKEQRLSAIPLKMQ